MPCVVQLAKAMNAVRNDAILGLNSAGVCFGFHFFWGARHVAAS